MQKSFTKNYLHIYIFQIVSIVLGFVSLLIVIPSLSSNKEIYGIYTVCTSIVIFLSYADLGFLGAGMKYAAECFSKDEKEEEIKLIGFSSLILFIMVFFLALIFLLISINPTILISNLLPREKIIARDLLLILSISSPIIAFQRVLQMIYGIRVMDYKLQELIIIGNALKIISVFYFFRTGVYDIVGYFLTLQILNLIIVILGTFRAKKIFCYDFKLLFRSFKFDKRIFDKIKLLAFSSLFTTLTWILYYELDPIAIGKLINASSVALYAIGFNILSFLRTLLGILYSPFSARFNHFIGLNSENDLIDFLRQIIIITFPLVVFPIVAILVFSNGLIISWVGYNYRQSIIVMDWLVLCYIGGFISYPAGMLIFAKEKLKLMYFINSLIPIIYWVGIFLTYSHYGIISFAVFKFIAFSLSTIAYLAVILNFIKKSFYRFFRDVILPYIPGIVIILLFIFCNHLFIFGKSKYYLAINASMVILSVIVALILSLFFVPSLRFYLFKKLLPLYIKKK